MGVTRQALKEKISLKPDYPAVLVELEKKRAAIMADINKELRKYKESMAGKFGHNIKRFVKSYPNLNRGYKLHRKE